MASAPTATGPSHADTVPNGQKPICTATRLDKTKITSARITRKPMIYLIDFSFLLRLSSLPPPERVC